MDFSLWFYFYFKKVFFPERICKLNSVEDKQDYNVTSTRRGTLIKYGGDIFYLQFKLKLWLCFVILKDKGKSLLHSSTTSAFNSPGLESL